ncbi:hypothetical protein HKD37_02G003822 [Glycine soja]
MKLRNGGLHHPLGAISGEITTPAIWDMAPTMAITSWRFTEAMTGIGTDTASSNPPNSFSKRVNTKYINHIESRQEGGNFTLTIVPAKFKTRAASSPAALILAIPSES